jgi:hypothetical protein
MLDFASPRRRMETIFTARYRVVFYFFLILFAWQDLPGSWTRPCDENSEDTTVVSQAVRLVHAEVRLQHYSVPSTEDQQ